MTHTFTKSAKLLLLLLISSVAVFAQEPEMQVNARFEVAGHYNFMLPTSQKFVSTDAAGGSVMMVIDDGGKVQGVFGIGLNFFDFSGDSLVERNSMLSQVHLKMNHVQIPMGIRYRLNYFFVEGTINVSFLVNSTQSGMGHLSDSTGAFLPGTPIEGDLHGTFMGAGLGIGVQIPLGKMDVIIRPKYNFDGGLDLYGETAYLSYASLSLGIRF